MIRVKFQLCLVFVGLLAFANAQNAGDTLVLVDNLAVRETHSIFFKNLQGKNHFTEWKASKPVIVIRPAHAMTCQIELKKSNAIIFFF